MLTTRLPRVRYCEPDGPYEHIHGANRFGRAPSHVLIAIPAYNEEQTIEAVLHAVRSAAPQFDVLVVDDGSRDATEAILRRLGVTTATHLCNLGYGRAVQTAIKYADRHGYDALITFDADGQHRARDIGPLYAAFSEGPFDLLIGSRFIQTRRYDGEPLLRRMGMRLFSTLIALLSRQRVYDTSSGLKVIPRRLFRPADVPIIRRSSCRSHRVPPRRWATALASIPSPSTSGVTDSRCTPRSARSRTRSRYRS